MASISYNGNTVDPAPGGANESRDAANTNFIYVQGHNDLTPEEKTELEGDRVQFQEYIGNNAYLCRYEPSDLEPIRAKSYVRAANVWHSAFKLSPELENAEGAQPVNIVLHKNAMSAEDCVSYLNDVGIAPDDARVSHRRIRVEASPNSLQQLQHWESVKKIEQAPPKTLFNDLSRNDMYASTVTPTGKNAGDGQIISVVDTGFDVGGTPGSKPTSVHPAFTGRINNLIAMGRPAVPAQNGQAAQAGLTNDPDGHGTHVCGSAAGNGSSTSMGGTGGKGGSIQGMAPSAALVVTSVLDSNGKLGGLNGSLYSTILKPAYDAPNNARIHTNSWGIGAMKSTIPAAIPYNEDASDADGFVWDNPDCIILFAAGNDRAKTGAPTTQIGDSAALKNGITVGASYSTRKTDGWKYVPTGTAGNPQNVAPFSSKGPSVEKRTKPDVAAPGTAILSACSRDPKITSDDRQWGGPTSDDLWMFLPGTSMATPLVAGTCAVIRQAVMKAGLTTPSAALIKALLINGALASGETDTSSASAAVKPNGDFGFGYVDVAHALAGVVSSQMTDEKTGMKAGDTKTYTITSAPVNTKTGLKVTLAYSDRAGVNLQNKLTLSLTQNNNTVTDTSRAAENNVQQIISHGPKYPVTLTVKCDRIGNNRDVQPFALVWQFIQ